MRPKPWGATKLNPPLAGPALIGPTLCGADVGLKLLSIRVIASPLGILLWPEPALLFFGGACSFVGDAGLERLRGVVEVVLGTALL